MPTPSTPSTPEKIPEWVVAQINRYFMVRYGKDYVYRAPETFTVFEQWMMAVSTGRQDLAEEQMTLIEEVVGSART